LRELPASRSIARARLLLLLLLVLRAWSPSTASAAEVSGVDYAAPRGCPDRAAFLAEIRGRTERFSESPRAARKFIVRLAMEREGRARGSLTTERSGRAGAPRTLEARSCIAAARALSFVIALILDPDASSPPEADEATNANPSDDAPPAGAPTVPDAPRAPSSPTAEGPAPGPAARQPGEGRVTWPRLGAALVLDVVGLAAPGAVFGGGASVDLRLLPWLELRGSLHRTLSTSVVSSVTSSSFSWTYLRLETCFDVFQAGAFMAAPCLQGDLGSVEAAGGGVSMTEQPSRLWSSVGLGGLARLSPSGPLKVEVSAGLFAPLDRTDFGYRPGLIVYRPPPVGAQLSVGAGVEWR